MRTNKTFLNTGIYKRIAAIQISADERELAVEALKEGESIADAILSAAHFLRLLFTLPHLKPAFKH